MSSVTRRLALQGVALSSASLMGCGGENSESSDLVTVADSESRSQARGLFMPRPTTTTTTTTTTTPTVTTPPTTTNPTTPVATGSPGNLPAGKYRINQPYLFQTVNSKTIPNRMPGGSPFLWDIYGPTNKYVDFQTGWRWDKAGGDWIDANLTRHGSSPWFSVPVMGAQGATAVKAYQVDVTNALKHCFTAGRWCAFLLVARNASRVVADRFNGTHPAPVIEVTYVGGQKVQLPCRTMASTYAGSSGPLTTAAQTNLPAFVEFQRPTAAVLSAVMKFVVTQHWSGNNAVIEGFLLDPPMNAEPVRQGLASTAGLLDANLENQPGVLGVHRYLDGTSLSSFVHPTQLNFNAEKNFDPAIYERGAQDKTKLPHVGQGKWITAGQEWDLVPSSYAGDGFKPLAQGLGALRINMAAKSGVVDGSIVGSSGTTAGNAMIYLPDELFGKLDHLFVRYYFRIGGTYKPSAAQRKQVYHEALTPPVWTTAAGKFGIGADHSTSLGGVSGSSGGGNGWQMRHSWYDCDAGTNGPDEGGWAVGYHLYDYYYQNPKGHNYGGADGSPVDERWGQRGGMGGMMYAGQWYCVETELKLNSVSTTAPGYTPDGILRTWIDGKLVYERTGMVFRTLPKVQATYNPDKMRPCRDLGIRGLWLNWFHGGKTVSTYDRTTFYTGLAWSKQYIGPMKM